MKVCIVGASGKLGKYMVQHALDRGYGVNAVCREQSVDTRRVDFALFMVEALTDDALIREAPAIVSYRAPSASAQ